MVKTRFPEPQYAKPISDAVLGLARAMCKSGTLKPSAVSHFSVNAPLEVEIDYEKGSEDAWKGYGDFCRAMEGMGFRSSRCQRMAADGTDKATLTFTIPDELASAQAIKELTAAMLLKRLDRSMRQPLAEARELVDGVLPSKAGERVKQQLMTEFATQLGIAGLYNGRGGK